MLKIIKRNLVFQYSVIFIPVIFLMTVQFLIQQKLFCHSDSIAEYITALSYWGKCLRNFFMNVCHGKLSFPMWDMSLGLGSDILTTLHWYLIGDPLAFLAVFVKPEHTTVLYHFLAILRIFLAGLSMLYYLKVKGFSNIKVLCGAFTYILCDYVFFLAVRHSYFMNPMIHLPLLFLGIDRILRNERPWLFIFSVFLSAVTNYYFLYIETMMVFVYALVEFFYIYRDNVKSNFIKYFASTLFFYVVGICLAAFIFIPNVYGFLTCSRTSEKVDIPFIYEKMHYVKLILCSVCPGYINSYTYLGFSSVVLPFAIVCFLNPKKAYGDKIILAVLYAVFLLFPIFGSAFNGFSYLTNRWCFAIPFVVSFFVIHGIDELMTLNKKKLLFCLGCPALFSFMILALSCVSSKLRHEYSVSYFMLLLSCVTLFFCYKRKVSEKIMTYLCLVLICVSGIINANVRYSPSGRDYLSDFYKWGDPYRLTINTPDRFVNDIKDDDFFRYEYPESVFSNNSILLDNKYSSSFYWSQVNSSINDFMEENGVASFHGMMELKGFDGREYLMDLMGCRYLFLSDGSKSVPSNFKYLYSDFIEGVKYNIYRNENSRPFAFSYDKIISPEDYNSLSAVEKQKMYGTHVVINGNEYKDYDYSKYASSSKKISGNFINLNGIEFTGENSFRAVSKKASMDFEFIADTTDNLYFIMDEYYCDTKDVLSHFYLNGNEFRTYGFESPKNKYGHSRVVKLSGVQTGKNTVKIMVEDKDNYRFKELAVYSLDYDGSSVDLDYNVYDVVINGNKISCHGTLEKNQVVFFNLPYSKGWSAKVNGKKMNLLKIQSMFTGLYLEKGEYQIELNYCTPYLKLSCLVSIICLIILLMFYIRGKRKNG